MKGHPEQLGAQDPERKNSPVAWESDEDVEALREVLPDDEPACFFNDQSYANGVVVSSGTVLLRCEHGIWIPAGAGESGKP